MKAIVVKPGVKDSIHMRDMPDPKMKPDEVAVKMIRVGLCGTDAEINHGLYGKPPDGDEYLILGHENLGVVEDVGKKVKGWKPGDLVVATVRRPCGICPQCKAGENDMCSSGKYTERGIIGRQDPSDLRAQIAKQLGAEYVCVANKALPDVPKETGYPDIVIEATGVSRVVFDAMEILGPNGVLCLLSVTGGDTMNEEPIDLINQKLVLGNQVVFGSVNANPRHFQQGVKDFVTIQK